jgi:uncharacterized protein GlcG (DUF336 family)
MMNLKTADLIVDAALKHGRQAKMKPLCAAVLDAAGTLIALKKDDGASFLRPQIAHAKAWGAIGMGMGTRSLATRAATHPAFIGAIGSLTEGRIIPVPGGVLIVALDKEILGAVGISGDHSDNDEACAVAGIVAAGFTADPGT